MRKIKAAIRVIYNEIRFKFNSGIECAGKCTSRCGNEFVVSAGGKIKIGYHMCALKNCRFSAHGGILQIGTDVGFNTNCVVSSHDNIYIGSNVEIGPNVCIYDHDHDTKCEGGIKAGKFVTTPVSIGNETWIGANVVILRGTKIGANCIISAGSIVKGEIPDNSIYIQKKDSIIKSNLNRSV